MTQKQSILSKIMTLFAEEEIVLQHNLLDYRIDAHFSKHKLVIEGDEQWHNGRDPAKKNFNIFVEIGKIQNYIAMSIKNSTKKALIDVLSEKILRLEFKSNNS